MKKLFVPTRSEEEIKLRQQLCKDLEYLIKEDKDIREEIIDEYVYLLDDKRFEDMQEYVNKELESDFGRG
tara:strand:+ start:67 stop:276 length:210 start_codon:yes stop_codon:yes gene_type:complete